ncbi:MAG: enoyl-CoA hydratase-related protein [Antricoccus sp.]
MSLASEQDAQSFAEIQYSVTDRVATITLDVPDQHNRLSFKMRREIVAALHRAEADDVVSVVLIRANGPSFCAGYDLKAAPEPGHQQTHSAEFGWTDQFTRGCVADWMTIWDLLKPVVAMVHGNCLAGGTELMSMCDIAFVADDARIGYPPMRGMSSPDVPYFPWKMTMAQAKYLQLTGNSVTGSEAAQMGWVAKSFPADELESQTMRELRAISSVPTALLSTNKQSVNQAYEIMGMRTHIAQSWQFHHLSMHVRPGAQQFAEVSREQGLKAALEWRDGIFRQEGFV